MRRTLPLSVLTATVLSGCAWPDLRPITKPGNPRVIERNLAPPKPVVQRVPAHAGGASVAKAQPDETADLPVMPSKSLAAAASKTGAAVVAVVGTNKATASAAGTVSGKTGAVDHEMTVKGQLWKIKASDVRLAATFERWAKESSERGMPFSVLWDAGKHVLIEAPTEYRGSFLDAVEQALKSPSILHSDYPLEACEYLNTPPVVRITRWGEQAKDCPEYR